MLVLCVQATERNLNGFSRQNEREQREHMSQSLARPIAHDHIDRRPRFTLPLVQQTSSFPHVPAHRDLMEHDLVETGSVDPYAWILIENRCQGSPAMVAHLEPLIVQ